MANEQGAAGGGSNPACGIQVLAKPIGYVCDIKCGYCFCLEKRALLDRDEPYHMPDDVLAAYIEHSVA